MNHKKTIFYILCLFFTITYSQQLSKIVDTKIGSKGESLACGYSFIGATYPFGMVQFTPSFFSPQKGFVVTQLSGADIFAIYNFQSLCVVYMLIAFISRRIFDNTILIVKRSFFFSLTHSFAIICKGTFI